MSSTIGENLRLTLFGQSHSPAVGMTLEGLPAGFTFDPEHIPETVNSDDGWEISGNYIRVAQTIHV